jgi:Leu/Phe-tRNA-protein transferase
LSFWKITGSKNYKEPVKSYPLKIFPSGIVFLDPNDDCDTVAIILEEIGYSEDFCLALDFDPLFIAQLMAAGFLVMSSLFENPEGAANESETQEDKRFILLPKHHLLRSCLFFPELHVKKSIRPRLPLYDLYFDKDFDLILDKCIEIHGDDWLTEPLVNIIRKIRENENMPVRPVSFALYREGKLAAGEFGILCDRVYTSYSGYYEEPNAGSVQMILTAQWLDNMAFAFWDLGMTLPYKLTLGAREISRKEFMTHFRNARSLPGSSS